VCDFLDAFDNLLYRIIGATITYDDGAYESYYESKRLERQFLSRLIQAIYDFSKDNPNALLYDKHTAPSYYENSSDGSPYDFMETLRDDIREARKHISYKPH
jgi:hypothetical protein